MKNSLLTCALFLMGLFVVNTASAQCAKSASADKACCASKASSTASVDTESKALLTAMAEQGVSKTVCEKSGTVSYFISNASPDGAEASAQQEVAFDEKLGLFVNVSPKKACCAKGSAEAKACDKKEAATGKACCAAKADKSTK